MEAVEKGMVNSSDGTPIYYEIFGNGPPLMLFNGLVCQRLHWRSQLENFAKKYQVVTFDYRGHNSSGFPENDRHLTIEWCARDGLAVIKNLQIKNVVAFGHSMGVAVLLRAGALQPQTFKALVLICGSVTNPFESMFYSDRMKSVYRVSHQIYRMAPRLVESIWKKMTRRSPVSYFIASQLGFNPNLAESKDVWTYVDGVNQNRLDAFYSILEDYTGHKDSDWLTQIELPTLLIAGEEDYVTPVHLMEMMAQKLKFSELEIVMTGSHNSHADFPQLVNRRIEKFLESLK